MPINAKLPRTDGRKLINSRQKMLINQYGVLYQTNNTKLGAENMLCIIDIVRKCITEPDPI